MKLKVNGSLHEVPDSWRNETLLMVLREQLGLVGAKFGCGDGDCGSCVIHLNGQAQPSCQLRAIDAFGREVLTIEGLAGPGGGLHPIQQAWLDERVAQCGYCQSGQIMQALALLLENPQPDDHSISDHMKNNLCRCGTQSRIRKAIKRVTGEMRGQS